jgi:hypothetical protein
MSRLSKTALRAQCTQFLSEANLDEPLEVGAFLHIFEKHPDYEAKMEGLLYWFVAKNEYGKRSLFIKKESGETVGFSYVNCISPYTPKQDFVSAMRNEVYEQIRDTKNRVGSLFECPGCCKKIEKSECHIDHVVPFKTISEEWCTTNGIDIKKGVGIVKTSTGLLFEDRNLASRWSRYHKEVAELVALCSSCNLKKGCKVASSPPPKVSRCLIE